MALLDLTILDWLRASWSGKLFYAFLVTTCATTLVRSGRLAWRLWSPWARDDSLGVRRGASEDRTGEARVEASWRTAFATVAATRHLAVVTLLLSLAFAIGDPSR